MHMKGKVTWGNGFMIRYVTQGGWTEMLHFVTKRERTENDRSYRYVMFGLSLLCYYLDFVVEILKFLVKLLFL